MPERILIVDDHPLTRSALSALLGQNGFNVVGEAADGESAIEQARELGPDLVLRGLSNGEAALSGAVARRLLETVRSTGGLETGVPDSIAEVLSAREVEVLLLLDERLETDEVAKRLFISEHTVRSHVKSVLRKLDVSSRREALEKLAQERGL